MSGWHERLRGFCWKWETEVEAVCSVEDDAEGADEDEGSPEEDVDATGEVARGWSPPLAAARRLAARARA